MIRIFSPNNRLIRCKYTIFKKFSIKPCKQALREKLKEDFNFVKSSEPQKYFLSIKSFKYCSL